MGLYVDNISKFEARRIVKWLKENYPEAKIDFIGEDGNILQVTK